MPDDNLRPYQGDALRHLTDGFQSRKRLVLSLPTGAGKTRVAAVYCRDRYVNEGRRILWIAHSEELLDQAYDAFEGVGVPQQRLARRYAKHKELGKPGAQVFFINNLVLDGPAGEVDLIVVDEAHHAAAGTYRDWFQTYKAGSTNGPRVLGLTATPYRLHEGEVADLTSFSFSRPKIPIFEAIAFRRSFCELAAEGFVAPFRSVTFETGMRFKMKLNSMRDDFAGTSLDELDTRERNSFIVDRWREREFGKTLIFVGTKDHAKHLANAFGDIGAYAVSGDPRREEAIERFRSGAVKVLVNVAIFKEGVDVPDIRTVFLARPTLSPILFTQMVGRGSRILPDKRFFYLVDIHDQLGEFENYLAGVNDLADRRQELLEVISRRAAATSRIQALRVRPLAQDPGVLLQLLGTNEITFAGWIVFETASAEARPVGALLTSEECEVLERLRWPDGRIHPPAAYKLKPNVKASKALGKCAEALAEGLYGRVSRLAPTDREEVRVLQEQAPIALGLERANVPVVRTFVEVLRDRASAWGIAPSQVGQVNDDFVRSPGTYEAALRLRGEQGSYVVLLNSAALQVLVQAVDAKVRGTLGFADGPRILAAFRAADPNLEASRGGRILEAIQGARRLDEICVVRGTLS